MNAVALLLCPKDRLLAFVQWGMEVCLSWQRQSCCVRGFPWHSQMWAMKTIWGELFWCRNFACMPAISTCAHGSHDKNDWIKANSRTREQCCLCPDRKGERVHTYVKNINWKEMVNLWDGPLLAITCSQWLILYCSINLPSPNIICLAIQIILRRCTIKASYAKCV